MVDQSTVPSSAIHNSCHPTSELLSGPSTLKRYLIIMLIYFNACIIFLPAYTEGRCKQCNAEDCGQCNNCVDNYKKKFGGPGKKKKGCVKRKCTGFLKVIIIM